MIKLQPLFIDMKTGNYISKDIKEAGVCTKQFIQATANDVWSIPIKANAFIINVYVDNKLVIPNKTTLIKASNVVILEFNEEVSGKVNVLYLVEDYTECEGVFDPEILKTESGINVFSINEEQLNI